LSALASQITICEHSYLDGDHGMSGRTVHGSRRGASNVRKARGATVLERPGAVVRPDAGRDAGESEKTIPAPQKRSAPVPNEIGVGVIGLGFMGRTHIHAYAAARDAGYDCRLVAVCDHNAARLGGKVDIRGNVQKGSGGLRLFHPKDVQVTTDVVELLANERVHLVSICTHTQSHVEIATRALEAGKHVLVEKPVALAPDDIRRLEAVAKRAKKVCMPAMCMRFWPGWSWLKEKIASGELGPVKSAVFQRLSGPPGWSHEFYGDARLTGGALFDLHIHDADIVHWLFGAPRSVASTGSIDHVSTLYRYARGPRHVITEGGWDHAIGFEFRMRYVVVFENATAEFNLMRDPALTLSRDGKRTPVKLEPITGYDGEIRHVLDCIRAKKPMPRATLADAVSVTRLLQAERKSIESGRSVEL
jgi:predicted dehydrogenase